MIPQVQEMPIDSSIEAHYRYHPSGFYINYYIYRGDGFNSAIEIVSNTETDPITHKYWFVIEMLKCKDLI